MSMSKAWKLRNYLDRGFQSFEHLKQLHCHLICLRLTQQNDFINTFLGHCFNFNKPHYSKLVFNQTPQPNIYVYNTMIRGFVSCNLFDESIHYYTLMRLNGLLPNNFTYPFVLKACARILCYDLGIKIHNLVVKMGFDCDVYVNTSLVCFYAKCGNLSDAHQVFDEMPERNVVSWTAIISGYIEVGKFHEGVGLFKRFLEVGWSPDSFTLVRVVAACAELGELEIGEWIHRYVDVNGMGRNKIVGTSLIDMYAKCGCMEKARTVFDEMLEKDVVSWTAMIQGYAANDFLKESLDMFFEMEKNNIKPDCYALIGVLSACTRLGAVDLAEQACMYIDKNKLVGNHVLGTALIDMYAKCGELSSAWRVFREIKERDIVVWNAAISGLSINGYVDTVFGLFAQMEKLGFQSNGNTFLGLLSGCTHAGLVDEGRNCFNRMKHDYLVTPTVEHYGCMVDLLSRAGFLQEAYNLIQSMPMEPNVIVWGALLGGCRLHRNTHLAKHALEQLIQLEPLNSGNYVLLSNVYSANNQWCDAEEVREKMNNERIQKIPGYSWIEVDGTVHEFVVGDKSHPLTDQIYAKLGDLLQDLREAGYKPTTEFVLFDVEEEEKEHFLGFHSEKLAIAFGLISLPSHNVIRVVKNLRVCGDCHAAIKIISKITGREIVVRDNNRFHRFVDGSCSCKDYW